MNKIYDFCFVEFRWHVEPPSGFNKNRFKSSSVFINNHFQNSNDNEILETNQQNSPCHFQPIYKAYALHNFYAQTNKELSFKKGDTILVKRRINDDWLEGEYQGSMGIFPVNYVELFPYEINEQQNEGEAIVKYDFIPEKTNELQLRKGEKVILLRKLDNNWYEGRINHIEGIFPADYIEVLREPKDSLNRTKSILKSSIELQQTPIRKINIIPELSLSMQKCEVLYDYSPQNTDELEIHVGDIINILEMCDDGWYCGVIEKSNYKNEIKFGTFPGNYVKLLSE